MQPDRPHIRGDGSSQLLDGHVMLVSGAGPGLGRAVATCAAEHGARLVLAARSGAMLAEIAEEVGRHGGEAACVPTDITDPEACRNLATLARARFGRIDSLVLNATRRTDPGMPVADADLDDWRRTMDVNVWGTLAVIQAVLPAMRAQSSGSIVLVGAMTTRVVSSVGRGDYAISKAAAAQIVRTLAYEVGAEGIRVNSIVPGWMDGPTVRALVAGDADRGRAMYDAALASMPLGRMPTPGDVAGSVIFLASSLSAPITGQALDVNAGQYMHA